MKYTPEEDERWRELQHNIAFNPPPADPIRRLAMLKTAASELAQMRNRFRRFAKPSTIRMIERRLTAVTRAIRRWKKKVVAQ